MFKKIDRISQNKELIIKAISQLDVINYETVSTSLPKQLLEGSLKLDHSAYKPADPSTVMPNGIGRYLLYDNPDTANPFSIWVFAFAPRQKTTIHDHSYKGTVTVLEGPISEKYYIPTDKNTARLVGRINRFQFHYNRDDLSEIFVHQLKAPGEETCLTLHIYGMEAYLVNLEGEKIDRRNLKTIYSKDKTVNKENIPYSNAYARSM